MIGCPVRHPAAREVIIRKQGKGVYVTDPETWLRRP